MNDKPVSPLRRRMIEDMSVRNFNEKTRNDYIRQVWTFLHSFDGPELARHLTVVREPRRIRAILSPDEVARLLAWPRGIVDDMLRAAGIPHRPQAWHRHRVFEGSRKTDNESH